ncbi:MAG: type II toxin-antitoxin system prevent-host-death family antitoxin [Rhodoferax sp.]
MDTTWQVQEAKNRFSEMIERAQTEGPQTITRHGRAVAKVVALVAGRVPSGPTSADDGFAAYLLSAPRGEALPESVRRSRKAPVLLGD